MENWSKTGKIKTIILGILFIPNIIKPIGAQPDFEFTMIILPLITGIIAIPLITKVNAAIFGQIIERPNWNDNPLTLMKPLSLFHFGAFFFLTVGLSMIVGTAPKYQNINHFGLSSVAFGIGILAGIELLLKMIKK